MLQCGSLDNRNRAIAVLHRGRCDDDGEDLPKMAKIESKACVWCLLNAQGEIVEQGSMETTIPALQTLVARLGQDDEL